MTESNSIPNNGRGGICLEQWYDHYNFAAQIALPKNQREQLTQEIVKLIPEMMDDPNQPFKAGKRVVFSGRLGLETLRRINMEG